MFSEISKNVTTRLFEVRRLLAHIQALEGILPSDPAVADIVGILRGLFFVDLYGAFEYAVEQSVQTFLQHLSAAGIPYREFEQLLFAITLHQEFESAATVAHRKKWSQRRSLLTKQISGDTCQVNDLMFHYYLQSISYSTIRDIFEWLCIPKSAVPDTRIIGYIDEISGARMEIAHGRKSAQDVGRRWSSSDLEKRLEAIGEESNYIIASFDEFVIQKGFVAAAHRVKYLPSARP